MPDPVDKKLYNRVKKLADKVFDSKTGVYKSSWIVRTYKKLGGKYKGKSPQKSGLKRWYKEKWVDLNRSIGRNKYASCGRRSAKNRSGKYPLCRPTYVITKTTPKTYSELSKKSISRAKKQKSKIRGKGNIKF
jgi:hypothetical protein